MALTAVQSKPFSANLFFCTFCKISIACLHPPTSHQYFAFSEVLPLRSYSSHAHEVRVWLFLWYLPIFSLALFCCRGPRHSFMPQVYLQQYVYESQQLTYAYLSAAMLQNSRALDHRHIRMHAISAHSKKRYCVSTPTPHTFNLHCPDNILQRTKLWYPCTHLHNVRFTSRPWLHEAIWTWSWASWCRGLTHVRSHCSPYSDL
jgi:hypothetical protein